MLASQVIEVSLVFQRKAQDPIFVTEFGMLMEIRAQVSFVAHVDNQHVACNTVEKSYQGCFEDIKSCKFNDFNLI